MLLKPHLQKGRSAMYWGISGIWLILISWIVFFWNLGSIGLIDETEPLFAEAARQMTLTGDWVTPYFNGETRFDKPPLIYWLMAAAYQVVGVNEWGARLPSALSAFTLTGFVFYTLRYFGVPSFTSDKRLNVSFAIQNRISESDLRLWLSAWLGATMIVFTPLTIAWARTGVADMLLTGSLSGALLAFFWGYAQPASSSTKTHWYLAFYVLIALAVLTKGPIGIVLPGLIIGCFVLYLGNSKEVLQEMRLLHGGLILLGLSLPWYVLVTWVNGESYLRSFFGYHNLERFTSVVNDHGGPWYSNFPVLLLGFAPWSIYLPVAIANLRFWKQATWQAQPRSNQLGLFALVWFLCIFVFFTFAVTKRPNYILPSMPAVAILVALLFSDLLINKSLMQGTSTLAHWLNRSMQLSGVLNVLLLFSLAGVFLYIPQWLGDDSAMPNLPEVVQRSGLPIWGALVWASVAVISTKFLLKRQVQWLWVTNLLGFMIFFMIVIMPAFFIMDAQRQLPLRQLAAIVDQQRQPNEALIMVGFKKPSLVFYTQKPVIYIEETQKAISHIKKAFSMQPNSASVLILIEPQRLLEMGWQLNQSRDIAKAGTYELVRVSKE